LLTAQPVKIGFGGFWYKLEYFKGGVRIHKAYIFCCFWPDDKNEATGDLAKVMFIPLDGVKEDKGDLAT
jgi:hypothetical protein